MNVLAARVLEHYRGLWGDPDRAAHFNRDARTIYVFKWLPRNTGEGVSIYATAGAAEDPIGPEAPQHRVELLVGLHPEDDRIARPLATLALTSPEDDPHLLHGHTVTFEQPLLDGRPFHSVLLMRPNVPIVPPLVVDDLHIDFLQVLPLYATELEFKKRTSGEQLLELWQQHQIAFWDPGRTALPGDA